MPNPMRVLQFVSNICKTRFMTKLRLYNSLAREKQNFNPIDPTRVTMYCCGPTVYSYAHIGNARAAVVADVLFRVLRHIYGEDAVVYARNLTDIDDKIIKASAETGEPIEAITKRYAKIYNEDLAALNCLPPTFQPKATDHINEMADLIVDLLDREIAYIAEGHVLFDVTKDKEYGKLSGRKLEDNRAGARVEVASYKKNPGDFVLWKPSKAGEPVWHPSNRFPPGRPGWHLECSAMIKKNLGETIDIHLGGIDLKFPHHENEIAQSECANHAPLANYWVHNEFLNMGKDKMSKSKGNVVLVHDLLKDWDGEVIRLALLKAHYRSELVWSEDLLKESKAQLDRWYRLVNPNMESNDGIIYASMSNLFDDLQANNVISRLVSEEVIAKAAKENRLDAYFDPSFVVQIQTLLGLLQKDPEDWFKGGASEADEAQYDALAKQRAEARKAKDWAKADKVRDEAKALGIILEDKPDGTTTWRKA